MRNENADNERKKHHRGRRQKKKGNIIANVILVIALIVFCVSGFQLFKIGKGYLDGRSEYDNVRNRTECFYDIIFFTFENPCTCPPDFPVCEAKREFRMESNMV